MPQIPWLDLTVPDADRVKNFYQAVVGWTPEAMSMGEYDDYVMKDGEEPVAGVCHARGMNAGLPPVWLVYLPVPDVEEAIARAAALIAERTAEATSAWLGASSKRDEPRQV